MPSTTLASRIDAPAGYIFQKCDPPGVNATCRSADATRQSADATRRSADTTRQSVNATRQRELGAFFKP